MGDILIKNALVVDGTGAPGYKGNIAIQDQRILHAGQVDSMKSGMEIDARGCVAAPGFIDMHCHADFSLPILPTAESLLHQGITTAVVGQCGLSPAPLPESGRKEVILGLGAVLSELGREIPWSEWSSFGDFLAFLRRIGVSHNVVPLAGQGTIRAGVMGFGAGKPTQDQMARMQREAAKALREGAWGLSTGLIYPPGSYASTDELTELTRVVAGDGGFYFSHIRGESETLLDAVREALQIGKETGAPVQISHFKAAGRQNWEKSEEALALIDKARSQGLDVSADMYPYTAGSTTLVTFLPEWAQDGGKEAILRRLSDPAQRAAMSEDMATRGFAASVDWSTVLITGCPTKTEYQGRFVSELAKEENQTPHEWIFDALFEADLQIHMAVFAMSEENRRREAVHPAMTFCTDGMGFAASGGFLKSLTHPRSYGAFPRILSRYVREEKILPLEQAIRKMTGQPAARLNLKDRGLIQPGFAADLVVFDPDKVKDTATYEHPHRYAEGIVEVIVNGQPVIHEGIHTGSRPGLVLSRK